MIQTRRLLLQSVEANRELSQPPQDCLTMLIRSGLTDAQIFDHILTLICSSHDPVAYTASFVCLLLAENPSVQDRLRSEIFETLGSREELTVEDVTEIKYLNQVSLPSFSSSSSCLQVIQETLRLYSMLPCLTRVTTCPVTIKDSSNSGELMVIPENTDVLVPLYLVNRDPDLWIQPSKFMPERSVECLAGALYFFLTLCLQIRRQT
jgi:cytochrome P450